MTVYWTQTAIDHLQAIRDYIARNSPGYAQALVDRVTRRTEALRKRVLATPTTGTARPSAS